MPENGVITPFTKITKALKVVAMLGHAPLNFCKQFPTACAELFSSVGKTGQAESHAKDMYTNAIFGGTLAFTAVGRQPTFSNVLSLTLIEFLFFHRLLYQYTPWHFGAYFSEQHDVQDCSL